MASSGKKGKKNKGTVISLQSFLSNGDVPVGTTQVAKNIKNVDAEDSDEGGKVLTVVCQLPTAPRANRIFDDNSISHKPPFIAYVTNLPFDVKEEDIYEYFHTNHLKSVRLPREDGDTGRVRGFGYIEFETRDDLIQALSLPDPTIKGRRIRIDVSNGNEQNSRQRGVRRGYESVNSNIDGRESANWRRDNQKRDSYNFGIERNFSRDNKSISEDNNSPGSWRQKNSVGNTSVEQDYVKEGDVYRRETSSERPKLVLKPRTLPLPELDVPLQISLESKKSDTNSSRFTGISAEKVYGSAKPVNTTARDLEIEERLADVRRLDNLRKEIVKTTQDIGEINLSRKNEVSNVDQNWRRKNAHEETYRNQEKKNLKTDKSREHNRRKYQVEKYEGSDNQRLKDGKRKDITKTKRDLVNQIHRNSHNQEEHIVHSSNKYSGLDEDSD
ncbi:eukaryotic translation initiation factor 4B isoform 2-T2 [Cochliomyia hominivorax]